MAQLTPGADPAPVTPDNIPAVITEPSVATETFNWLEASDAEVKQVWDVLNPKIPIDYVPDLNARRALVKRNGGGEKSPRQILEAVQAKQEKKIAEIPENIRALAYPDDLQAIIDRLGGRKSISEHFPTEAQKPNAMVYVAGLVKNRAVGMSIEAIMALPISGPDRYNYRTSTFAVALENNNAPAGIPVAVAKFVEMLQSIDPETTFGRGIAKAGMVRMKLPNTLGKDYEVRVMLPETFDNPPQYIEAVRRREMNKGKGKRGRPPKVADNG